MNTTFPRLLKRTRLALAIAAVSGSVMAQAPQANLEQVLKQAIEKNPEVQASWHSFLASGQEAKQAGSADDLTVDFFADYSFQRKDYIANENFDGASANLSFSKNLYDGSRTESTTESFKNTELVRYFELMDSVENTALEAYIAYQDVLRYRELTRLAQKNYDSHLEVYDKIAAGVETGHTRGADLEQINGRLALAESNLLTEKANLHDVSARFLRIVGETPAKQLDSADLTTDALPNSFDEVMKYAYEHNPSFHASMRDIEAKLSSVEAERADNKPRLDLTGQYGIQTYDEQGFDNEQQDGKVALEFRYNLYNGDRTSSAVQKAHEEVSRAEYIREKTCVDMRQNLQIAYNDVRKITEQLPILNQHRNSSDRVRVAFNDQFSINQRTLLDLLDTEIEFFQSSRAYANAHYDRNISVAKTLASMGKLLSSLDISRGEMPSLSDLGAEKLAVSPEAMCPITEIPEMDLAIKTPKAVETSKFQAPDADNSDGNTYRLEIKFKFNSSEIDSKYDNDLAELAKFMQDNPDTVVEIRGHASLEGSEEYNQWLSEKRADAVVNTLVKEYNVDPLRLSGIGLGETQPLINEMTTEAHQANRRIESNIKIKQ